MSRMLVTGATGFIGSHVCRELAQRGHEVGALVRNRGRTGSLADLDAVTMLEGDLTDTAALRDVVARWRPETCIHLAWYAEPGKYLTSPANVACLEYSLRLLEALIDVGCGAVVMAGTCAEYDADRGFLREDGPTRPATIYAASKLSLLLMAERLAAAAGMRFSWGRLFYLYGPGEDERRLVPALARALLRGERFPASEGAQVRDYLHVEDVAGALVALAEQGPDGVTNISSGVPVTMRALMELIGALIGRADLIDFGKAPYRAWDPIFICGDNRRLRAEASWTPRYPTLLEGLRATLPSWR